MLLDECSRYRALRFVGKFRGYGVGEFDLGRGLREVIMFLVMIRLCQMKRHWGHLLSLVDLE